jgi:hypothetical protein
MLKIQVLDSKAWHSYCFFQLLQAYLLYHIVWLVEENEPWSKIFHFFLLRIQISGSLRIWICNPDPIHTMASSVGGPDPDQQDRICLGLLDSDPLVRGPDPDPSLFSYLC